MLAVFRTPHRHLGETEASAPYNIHAGARVSSGTLAHHFSPLARALTSHSSNLFPLPNPALKLHNLAPKVVNIALKITDQAVVVTKLAFERID